MARRLRVATRGSTLARTQTDLVIDLLKAAADVEIEPVVVETTGDRRADAEIWQLGGRGVFVKEVQQAVLDGRADMAVHSAKDLPATAPTDGLVIAAVPEREDARDALVGGSLDDLPPGARIGTGSVRRRAQLAWLRPDLTFGGLRGNIETRLAKADQFDAIVVATAALRRLGRMVAVSQVLDADLLVPQVGQGALAVECRSDDDEAIRLLASVDHPTSRRAVAAERAFLAEVGGGCDMPVGGYATVDATGAICLTGVMASGDGRVMLRHTDEGGDADALGSAVGRHLLDQAGGSALIAQLAAP